MPTYTSAVGNRRSLAFGDSHENEKMKGVKMKGVRLQWHLVKPICMERSSLYPGKKAGGLMAISRSVTVGNHRKQSQK